MMAVDFELLKQLFFTFDEPVPYEIDKEKNFIHIHPVALKDSPLFFSSCDVLTLPKDEMDSVEIIQMSYLEFLIKEAFKDEKYKKKLFCILFLCLKTENPRIFSDEKGKFFIFDEKTGIKITAKQFEEIRRIIMYQNIYGYDDSYIHPDLKESIEQTKALRMNGIEVPSLERKIAIITAHSGLPKQEQMKMSLRGHEMLFQEVCGEIEFLTTRPIAIYGGNADKMEHWVYKKKKNKFDGFLSPVDSVTSKFGTGLVPS